MIRHFTRAMPIFIAILLIAACDKEVTSEAPSEAQPSATTQAEEQAKDPEPEETKAPEEKPAEEAQAGAPAETPASERLAPIEARTPQGVEFVRHADWSESEPMTEVLEKMEHAENAPITYIVVTHSGVVTTADNELRMLNDIRVGQFRNGWGDINVHYVVGPSGKVYEGRDLRYRADGEIGSGMGGNSHQWGKCVIMLLGNFRSDEQEFTEAAKDALSGLVQDRTSTFNTIFRDALDAQLEDLKVKLGPNAKLAGLDVVRLRVHPVIATTPVRGFLEEGEN